MSTAKSGSSPDREGLPETPASKADTQSVDSSDDSDESSHTSDSESASSRTNSAEPEQKESQPIDNKPDETLPLASSEGSRTGQSESESDEEQSEESGSEADSDATFRSLTGIDLSGQKTKGPSPSFATPAASLPTEASSYSPTKSIAPSANATTSSPLVSPQIVTPAKNLVFESIHTPKSTPAVPTEQLASKGGEPTLQKAESEAVPTEQGQSDAGAQQLAVEPKPSTTSVDSKADRSKHGDKSTKRKSSKKTPAGDLGGQQPPAKVRKESKVHKNEGVVRKEHRGKTSAKSPKSSPRKAQVETPVVKPPKKAKKSSSHKKVQEQVATPKAPSTSEDSEASKSSPERPSTSARIPKISDGRRFQNQAMVKAKQCNNIIDSGARAAMLSKALKAVYTAHFDIQPTHSYENYHKVFGTGLQHIKDHLVEICNRYTPILGATAELEITSALHQGREKRALMSSEMESRYFPIWQFNNDLLRSSYELTSQASTSSSSASAVAGRSVEFKDLPSLHATAARAGVVKSHGNSSSTPAAEPVAQPELPVDEKAGVKVARKRKRHGSSKVSIFYVTLKT